MKFLKYCLKLKNKKYESLRNHEIAKRINALVYSENKTINTALDRNEQQVLFQNILIKVINKRCNNIGLYYTSSLIKNRDEELKVKLFGDCNYLYDSSEWVDINEINNTSDNDNKSYKRINLKNDLYFSDSHIYLTINEHLLFYNILQSKNIRNQILPLIHKSNLETLSDLQILIDDIFHKKL